jgi:hypothetical protein
MSRLGQTLTAGLCALFALSLAPACAHMTANAEKDPQRCERDPKCDKKRARSFDCSAQCADDPACMDRCRQVQVETGSQAR